MAQSPRLIRACLLALCILACTSQAALAQDNLPDPSSIKAAPVDETNPVRLVLIDVTEDAGDAKSILEGLTKEMNESKRIEVVETRPVILSFVDRKITKELLRTSEGRESSAKDIAEVIAEHNLEGMIIMDAYSGGRKLQVILFDTDGKEADEQKLSLKKRKRVSSAERDKVRKRIFEKASPVATKQREAVARAERERIEAELEKRARAQAATSEGEGSSGGREGAAVTKTTEKARAPREGGQGGLRVQAGFLLGQRTFVLESDTFGIDQTLPMAGATGQVQVSTPVSDGLLLVGGTFRGSWAPLRLLDASAEEETLLTGHFVDVGANFDLDFPYKSLLKIGLDLGADVVSMTIDQNATYTGHRYIWGRAGLGVEITPISRLAIRLHGGALPVLQALTSGGAYGAPGLDVGIEAGGGVEVGITESLGLALDGRYQTFTQLYTSDSFEETLTSSDQILRGAVSITYRK